MMEHLDEQRGAVLVRGDVAVARKAEHELWQLGVLATDHELVAVLGSDQ